MADIRIKDLPLATGGTAPVGSDAVAIDGLTTRKTTITTLGDAAVPVASQAEAEAGVNAVKRMTPVTTKQSIASEVGVTLASKAQGDLANTALQSDDIGVTIQAFSANLDTLAAVVPGASGLSILSMGAVTDVRNYLDATPYVATRTALKAIDTTKEICAILTESGREGIFVWTTGDYSGQVTADTLEGVFVKANAIAASSGAWVRVSASKYNITWFGAVGDGTTNNTAAIQAAMNLALSYGTGIFVPKGKFRVNSQITGTFPVASSGPSNNKNNYGRFEIIGDAMDLSILYFPTNAGIEVVAQSFQQTVCANKVSFTAGQAGGGNDALYVRCRYAFFGSYTAQSDIVECCFRGDDGYGEVFYWKTCVKLYNMTSVNFDRNTMYGPVLAATAASYGDGVYVSSTTTPGIATSTTPGQGTTYNFTNNNFVFLGRSIVVGDLCQVFSVGAGNHILNGFHGVFVEAGITEARQLMVTGTEISVNGDGIRMNTACSGSNINSNYIAVAPGRSGVVLNTNAGAMNSGGTTIQGNTFVPLDVGAANGIYVNTDYAPVTIDGNTFLGLATGIALDAGSKQVDVGKNRFMNCTNNVIDSGIGNGQFPQNDRGLVTQLTSKSTSVTLNKMAGTITTNNQALASGGIVTFTVANSKFKGEDLVVLNVLNGNYSVRPFSNANGSFQIALKNETGGSLSDAILISFSVIKSAQSS